MKNSKLYLYQYESSLKEPYCFVIFQFEKVWRSAFFLFMILFNVLMFRTFNKALQSSQTTVEASIVNTAANFVTTVNLFQILSSSVITNIKCSLYIVSQVKRAHCCRSLKFVITDFDCVLTFPNTNLKDSQASVPF